MKIIIKSFLRLVENKRKGLNKYAVKDKEYIITAITVITRRFGPSGSLKKKNIVLDNTIAVMNKINNEIFFDLKYII